MATKKTSAIDDARKAMARYMDQPGQWRDVTPKRTKARQAKAWKELEAMMKKK